MILRWEFVLVDISKKKIPNVAIFLHSFILHVKIKIVLKSGIEKISNVATFGKFLLFVRFEYPLYSILGLGRIPNAISCISMRCTTGPNRQEDAKFSIL